MSPFGETSSTTLGGDGRASCAQWTSQLKTPRQTTRDCTPSSAPCLQWSVGAWRNLQQKTPRTHHPSPRTWNRCSSLIRNSKNVRKCGRQRRDPGGTPTSEFRLRPGRSGLSHYGKVTERL